MMFERIFVFTPYGPRLEPETVQAVLALQWHGPIRFVFQRDNPYPVGRDNILHQYQQGRDLFLRGDDDAMLVVESDIIPPPDALQKLAAIEADVAYGVYMFRNSPVINIFERYPGTPRNEGESLSIHPDKLQQAVKSGVIPCSGGGLGCALIRRRVLEMFDFWHGETGCCDTYFNREVMRAGLDQVADMSVICGHKDEFGTVIWPVF
jgi:hypothetical protein